MGAEFQLILVLTLALTTSADFTENCPEECQCAWATGNKQANCSQSNLKDLPITLSSDIQNLDLSLNDLTNIHNNAFVDTQLINLKKLFMRQCRLESIGRYALKGLSILIALDLSNNSLKTIHPDTFKETVKIRYINLNDNQLEILDDGLFSNLPYLQIVELNNNRIYDIGDATFGNVPRLSILQLAGNRLEYIKVDLVKYLPLTELQLQNNAWRCDAKLHSFRNWMMRKRLYKNTIMCEEPDYNKGKSWMDLWLIGPSLAD